MADGSAEHRRRVGSGDVQRRRGSLRERILASALELFRDKGYVASSVDEIASRARAAKGSVYWHFAGKEDLLLALIDREIARIRTRLASPEGASRGGASSLIASAMDLGLWRSRGLEDLRRVTFSAVESSGDSPERSRLCRALFERGLALYKEVVSRLAAAFAEAGPPAGLTAESAAECLLACVWGAVHILATRGWPQKESDRLACAMRTLFLGARQRARRSVGAS